VHWQSDALTTRLDLIRWKKAGKVSRIIYDDSFYCNLLRYLIFCKRSEGQK
jgi:hypothetical protein